MRSGMCRQETKNVGPSSRQEVRVPQQEAWTEESFLVDRVFHVQEQRQHFNGPFWVVQIIFSQQLGPSVVGE